MEDKARRQDRPWPPAGKRRRTGYPRLRYCEAL